MKVIQGGLADNIMGGLAMVKAAAVNRADGWVNAVTGLGTSLRDKLMGAGFQHSVLLSDQQLEDLFDDDMAARIVEKLPEEALRQGFRLTIKDESTEARETEDAILGNVDDLHAVPKMIEAWCWGRLYGGGAIYVVTDDPASPSEPLDPAMIRSIKSLLVIDKRNIMPWRYDDDIRSPTFDQPILYQVLPSGAAPQAVGPITIHASRLIVFEGSRTPMRRKAHNQGWSISVLQRVHDVLRQFATAFQATAHTMQDGAQGVFKMKGLIQMVASGGKQQIADRMEMVDMGRSVARALVIDAETENFERSATNLSGHDRVLDIFMLRLSAAADMPMTVLMKQSPAGMNATGESDRAIWEDSVKTAQTLILKPRIERLLFLIMSALDGPTAGQVPENWNVEFNPLRQQTETERATVRKTVAETDALYIDRQVLTAGDVAMSRFGVMGWSMETKIDLDAVKQMAELDREQALKLAANPPEPVPVPGAEPAPEPQPGE